MTARTEQHDADISVSEARARLAELVRTATRTQQPVYLSRHGHRVAALVDVVTLDHVLELAEDMEDLLHADQARRETVETGETPIPWDDVKADLGL